MNAASDDSKVVWYAPRPGGALMQISDDFSETVITGTGAEIANAYVPPIKATVQHLAKLGAGRIKMKFWMNKDGSVGTATLKWDSFGNYQEQFVTQAATKNILCEGDILITSANDYRTLVRWSAGEEDGANADTNILNRNRAPGDTVATGIETEGGNILDFDPTIAVGDAIGIYSKEIWATCGGTFEASQPVRNVRRRRISDGAGKFLCQS